MGHDDTAMHAPLVLGLAQLTTTTVPARSVVVVHVTGEVDIANSAPLTDALLAACAADGDGDGDGRTELDVSALAFCDLSGARALLEACRRLTIAGTCAQVSGASPQLRWLLSFIGAEQDLFVDHPAPTILSVPLAPCRSTGPTACPGGRAASTRSSPGTSCPRRRAHCSTDQPTARLTGTPRSDGVSARRRRVPLADGDRPARSPREVTQPMSLLGWPLLALLAVSAVAYPVLTLPLWPRVRGLRRLRAAPGWPWSAGCRSPPVLLVAVAVNHSATSTARGPSPGIGAHPGTRPARRGLAPAAASGRRYQPRVPGPRRRTGARPSRPRMVLDGAVGHPWPGGVGDHPRRPVRADLARVRLPAAAVLPAGVRPPGLPGGPRCSPVSRAARPGACSGAWTARPRCSPRSTPAGARPMVLVMMSPSVAPPRDTECTDVPAGRRP